MKKIILILFLFFLLYACYYIYNATIDNKTDITLLGDNTLNNPYFKELGEVNNIFVNADYHMIDLLDIIKYNKEIDNKNVHQILRNTDILIISIGMNDIYYKLNDNLYEVYTYMNNIINNYEEILKYISKYNYKEVYILGYYDIYNKYNDIFTYTNYKLNNLANLYGFTYLNLNKIFYNNDKLLQKRDKFDLNNDGYRKIYELIVEKLNNY